MPGDIHAALSAILGEQAAHRVEKNKEDWRWLELGADFINQAIWQKGISRQRKDGLLIARNILSWMHSPIDCPGRADAEVAANWFLTNYGGS